MFPSKATWVPPYTVNHVEGCPEPGQPKCNELNYVDQKVFIGEAKNYGFAT